MDKDIWDVIYTAIHKKQIITFSYQSMSKKTPERRVVAPYQLIFDDGNWDVRCYDYTAKDKRIFTVSEMKDFSLLDGKPNAFEVPPDFDFRKETTGAFGCFTSELWDEYKFKLSGYAKRYAKGRIFGLNQVIIENTDNSITLTFTSNQYTPILTWALGWGKDCVILEPQKLVTEWKEQIKAMNQITGD